MPSETVLCRIRQNVLAGKNEMAHSRVAICATVRDCGEALSNNIPNIDRLAGLFASANIVIVENDSVDETKQVLQEWSKGQPSVSVISTDTGIDTIPDEELLPNPWFSRHRISLMAGYRNQYLDFIESRGYRPDFVIVLDPDVAGFSVAGIAHSLGSGQRWDGICANGLRLRKAECKYYDTYAFQARGDDTPQTKKGIFGLQDTLAGMLVGDELVRVDSAFGGLAIYRHESLRGARYTCETNDDPEIEARCEHIGLHRSMARQGADRIYINPAQVVLY